MTPAGKEPPLLEGKPLTKDNIKVIMRNECCDQTRWGVSGEMPRNPVGVLALLGWSQRKVIKDIHNNRMEQADQLRMTAMK